MKHRSTLPAAFAAALCLSPVLCALSPQKDIERVSVTSDGVQGNNSTGPGNETPSISSDGRYVAFSSFSFWASKTSD